MAAAGKAVSRWKPPSSRKASSSNCANIPCRSRKPPSKRLNNNAPALDVYLWLAYRLHAIKEPRLVTWAALKSQFGAGFSKLYHFKNKFPGTLALATAVYPDARVEIENAGVRLIPSRPPVAPRLVAIAKS